MAPAITYIVPAMHLVCNLVIPDAPGLNVTNTDSGLTVSQSAPQDHYATLPDGYVANPDIGAAYKVVRASANWTEARKRCFDEGAQLAVIDTLPKLNYIKSKVVFGKYIHVGIHRFEDEWVSVISGAALQSIPWSTDWPKPLSYGSYNCVMVSSVPGIELHNNSCNLEKDYVCELPIPMSTGIGKIAIN